MNVRKNCVLYGFTLVELLVVISIIGVLISLIFPAVMTAREAARSAQCKSNLRQIGIAMTRYIDQQGIRGKFPDAAILPSFRPKDPDDQGTWPLYDVLAAYAEGNREIYHCPSDYGPLNPDEDKVVYEDYIRPDGNPYTYGDSYYENEGLSYEYPSSRLAGRTIQEVLSGRRRERSSSEVWIVYDFESFHGRQGDNGSRNFVYLDGHVDALIVAE